MHKKVISVLPGTLLFGESISASVMSDIEGHWAKSAIEEVAKK